MRGLVVLLFLLAIPIASPISADELAKKYSFDIKSNEINVTSILDFMIDKNNNGVNDELVFEVSTKNVAGPYIFIISLSDYNSIISAEKSISLDSGTNKLNISINSSLLSQPKYNYSLRIFNSSGIIKHRKDRLSTSEYNSYEEGFKILKTLDFVEGNELKVNVTLNSNLEGVFETVLYIYHNDSAIFAKENKTLSKSTQALSYKFDSETIRKTRHIGSYRIASLQLGKKTLRINNNTQSYDYRDFAAESYISSISDTGIDSDKNSKFDSLKLNAELSVKNSSNYVVDILLYDDFGSFIGSANFSGFLNESKINASIYFNGSGIYHKKLNGPYLIKQASLYKNEQLIDKINDVFTGNYNYNQFEMPELPDLKINISSTDYHNYGINEAYINVTISNQGKKHAFNFLTEIFDNTTFSQTNKSSIQKGNKIVYQFTYKNITDFEMNAVSDSDNSVEEDNEENNIQKLAIKLNKKPVLKRLQNITINETEVIIINLSASDPNNDVLKYSLNNPKFKNSSNVFMWPTTTKDSGDYIINASASDGFLDDHFMLRIIIKDMPEKDFDNDGTDDSLDPVIGNESGINTTTFNISVQIDDLANLNESVNKTARVRLRHHNISVIEFPLNFSAHKLNLTNLAIEKQAGNSTGAMLIRGLKLPNGTTKTVFVEKINNTNGICIRDEEILSLNEISDNCSSNNEYKVECDGTAQNSYICIYNSTISMYKVDGLKHSGVMQISYSRPATKEQSPTASSNSGSPSGGGGGIFCANNWECGTWSECIDNERKRSCIDANKCLFAVKKPKEKESCEEIKEEPESKETTKISQQGAETRKEIRIEKANGFSAITGRAAAITKSVDSLFEGISLLIVIAAVFLAGFFVFRRMFK